MGVLQIDTINVVARSPYFVLFSRLGIYQPAWLDELLTEGAIFEHWAHAACFIPIEDFSLIRRFILDGDRVKGYGDWITENHEVIDGVLSTIRSTGPVKSADFKSQKESGGWWNRKVEKWALEYWLDHGELMVSRRENFQRVYDLTERVHPGWDDEQVPSRDEVICELIRKSVKALGVARPEWIADYYRLPKREVFNRLPEMVARGELLEVRVKEWNDSALYSPHHEPLIQSAVRSQLEASQTTLLSPFDPVTWDRTRARELFNYDFMIQAYTPADKRQFGYFPLPILHKGALIGRLDAKAFRKEGVFEIRGFYPERDIILTKSLMKDLKDAIHCCAQWHGTERLTLSENLAPEAQKILTRYL